MPAPVPAPTAAPVCSTRGRASGGWAGIKLPGGQYRKREQLAAAHDVLRRIAGGEINSRQLPDNAALLARNEGLEVTPVPGVVVHLPIAQVGPQPAA